MWIIRQFMFQGTQAIYAGLLLGVENIFVCRIL